MQFPVILSLLFALAGNGIAAQADPGWAQDPLSTPSGKLEWIGPKLLNAGTVIQGQLVTHTMRFMNGGEDDLILARLRPTCRCMTVAAVHDRGMLGQVMFEPGHVLPPGEVMELGLTIDTTGKGGSLHSRLEIHHSGSAEPEYARVVMEVVEPFVLTPSSYAVGALRPNDRRTGTLELTNSFGQPFAPELVANRFAEHIDVSFSPIEPDEAGLAQRWRIDFEVRGGLPYRKNGQYPLQFTAQLPNHADFAQSEQDGSKTFPIRVLVQVEVIDWITHDPRSLSFGRLWSGREYEQSFGVYCHDEEFELALSAADVTIEGSDGGEFPWRDHVELTLTRTPEDNSVHIAMKAHSLPKIMNKPFTGSIVVATGHPKIGTFRVPFSGQHR